MADSAGLSALTGQPLSDFDHVQQSVRIILTTPIGSRVMRRYFGSDVPDLIDRKLTQHNVLLIYAASALAILKWEPRFRVRRGRVLQIEPGLVDLEVGGVYYPRGHLGDYSVAEDKSVRVPFVVNGNGLLALGAAA